MKPATKKSKSVDINLNTLNATVRKLRNVINDQNAHRMNLSTVIGYLGELVVLAKLHKEGMICRMKANQSGYDIECPDDNIKIDVKASRCKDEFIKQIGCHNWGWALKHENKKKPITCTHFVCVQFDANLEVIKYYVIPVNALKRFPKGVGQFGGVQNAFAVFPNTEITGYHKNYKKLFEKSISLLNDPRSVRKVKSNGSLSKVLKRYE